MVKRINILDENTSNKIAAGEVVERPSSVVKELVENAIDAGSKNITIEIKNGGVSLIKVIDDGSGIVSDDLKVAFLPHATSKIRNSDDIFNISTLGFRGEALPSIASVSKISMKSRTEDSDIGAMVNLENGEITSFENTNCNKGTTIEVKDLFYNVPARKKFLKSESREGSIITDLINRIAMCYPDVSFKYFNNNKKVLHTYGTGKLLDVLRIIYGKSVCEDLVYFESHSDIYSVYGYIGRENISRGSRNYQSIFVNKRYVKDRRLSIAVENAFKSFATVNKFPIFIMNVESYPELIDVNIHPTKSEVKFKDDRTAFSVIFNTVHEAMKKDVMGKFSIIDDKPAFEEEDTAEKISLFDSKDSFNKITPESVKDDIISKVKAVSDNNYIIPSDVKSENESKRNSALLNNGVSISSKEGYTVKDLNDTSIGNYEKTDVPEVNILESNVKENTSLITDDTKEKEIKIYTEDKKDYKAVDEDVKATNNMPLFNVIGQYNKTYILAEYNNDLYLIDQHAAHEKCMFEDYMKRIKNDEIVVQRLLVPEVIELDSDKFETFKENQEVFSKAGFIIEEFGDNTITVKEVPYFLGKTSSRRLIIDMIDNLESYGSGNPVDVKYNRIATMACKSAIKAHDELSIMEMKSLLESMQKLDDPFHCPHGRPTIIRFTLNDIEKRFRRIV